MKKVILTVVGLIGLAGCCYTKKDHMAGVCDCDPRTWGCRTGPAAMDGMIVGSKDPEAIKAPKEAAKQMP